MLKSVYNPAHLCRRCATPLVELLSDPAGRIFGCIRCRAIDPCNVARPAAEVYQYTLTKRARRRQARAGIKGRRGARRVSRTAEGTRPPHMVYVVLPADCFREGASRDIGNGYAIGLMALPRWDVAEFYRWEGGLDMRTQIVTIHLRRVGGWAWGYADRDAPDAIALPAFERLYQERVEKVAPAFFAMCARDGGEWHVHRPGEMDPIEAAALRAAALRSVMR